MALGFERYKEDDKSMASKAYVNAKNVPFILYCWQGIMTKTAAARIPQIEGIKAYPTLLLVDKMTD